MGLKMFESNTQVDDIAILMNLISQLRDGVGEESGVMDESSKIEYGVGAVVEYIRKKYGEQM